VLITPILGSSIREKIVPMIDMVRIEGIYKRVRKQVPPGIFRLIIYAIMMPKKAWGKTVPKKNSAWLRSTFSMIGSLKRSLKFSNPVKSLFLLIPFHSKKL
jgi:hypothetical protein